MIAPAVPPPAHHRSIPRSVSWRAERPLRRLRRTVALLLIAGTPAVFLSGCGSKGYQAASYSSEKLATPAHNMSQRDYPFDSDGNYRTDWVKSGSTRPGSATTKRSSSSAQKTTTVASAPPAPRTAAPTPSRSSASAPQTIAPPAPRSTVPPARSTTTASSSPASPASPAPKPAAPKPKPAPPAARYHTVLPKQTLWAISQKYGVTVDALKRANGLSSDLIRDGQSLRLP